MRGPNVMVGYWNRPEVTAEKFDGQWLRTGDMVRRDERGYIYYADRADDMIVSGGENVHPVQVEEVLNEHAAVEDSMVVGIPHEHWGRLVVAYVVPADGSLTAEECERHCREHPMLADYKRPRAYRLVDSLPVTATGKKIHYKAREQAADEFSRGLFTRLGTPA